MMQYTLHVEGMQCGMCEAHVNDAVRKRFPQIKKVTSSHTKKRTVVLSPQPLDEAALRAAIAETGYDVVSVEAALHEKHGLFARR
mgnify:CR=1 FL=1